MKHRIFVTLILLLAAALRFYCLDCQSLWSDEGNSVALTQHSFAQIARHTAFDIHPPFYYWLLKLWAGFFGTSEFALRSLSAMLGVGVVLLVWLLGNYLFNRRVAMVAAFIAALSPLLVHYSQEARMYMLLTFLSCLTVYFGLRLLSGERRGFLVWGIAYIFTVTAGLYTHYAFPLILVVVNLAALVEFIRASALKIKNANLWRWAGLQIVPLLFYLPWLPTAWRQLTTWPSEPQENLLGEILQTVAGTLLFGLSWPFNLGWTAAASLTLALVIAVTFPLKSTRRDHPSTALSLTTLYLWFLLPVLLTLAIFSPAFLKFLLVAVPPLAILLGLTVVQLASIHKLESRLQPGDFNRLQPARHHFSDRGLALPGSRWLSAALGGAALLAISAVSLLSLFHYYTNPAFARDNYRGIVQFIRAVAGADDAIILNAEGQQDVFNYYYRQGNVENAAQVFPLPRHRPLNQAETLAELQEIAGKSGKIYAVYWASQQADPAGLIENWLNSNLFKATDHWYGNVRLVSYATPRTGFTLSMEPVEVQLGDNIRLTNVAIPLLQIAAGDILQVALQWQATEAPGEDYAVFLQLLDPANHLAGQRDAPPVKPVSAWSAGQPVVDPHGIFVEPGTPPGSYRLIAGMYNRDTGQRLPVTRSGQTTGADFIELGQIDVISAVQPLPVEAFNIQHPVGESLSGLLLLGYDLYKPGHRSTPDTPLHPGDPVHLVTYWQRHQPAGNGGEIQARVVANSGQVMPVNFSVQPGGAGYPPAQWQPVEIIRVQNDFFLSGLEPGLYRLEFSVGDSTGGRIMSDELRVTSYE